MDLRHSASSVSMHKSDRCRLSANVCDNVAVTSQSVNTRLAGRSGVAQRLGNTAVSAPASGLRRPTRIGVFGVYCVIGMERPGDWMEARCDSVWGGGVIAVDPRGRSGLAWLGLHRRQRKDIGLLASPAGSPAYLGPFPFVFIRRIDIHPSGRMGNSGDLPSSC